ncbi:MAG: prefoldin subunit alpha [Methanomassiliicoccales archaeon]|uniref:prefoldin subunit alpha n=1 Tax=Candidatus Methanarcanum hacksteinii TaxID=2911857 RepID=UPI0015B04971|nr:prefoldin subunit alpha [Candidatus Methanomethylophilaceae archaeon]MCI6024499.1 prefoldin subunit alpha [Methanomassiliicoccales archaeon]MDY4580000.1 prefoldin subunit alpha [Candidatus Methanarcanum hacksteinii]MDD7478414.1 prefoldin subunit alpha [Methanomassiliicoccales archaeon]MDO5837375.1 prefoldin subunit alpha [Methanomassiliicoccales archaeon]
MNDDELRQALATLETMKVQLDAMAQQARFFQLSLEETMRAHDTLDAFAKAKEGDEVLVPAGASSFVIATVTSKRKAVVGIGNKVSIDMDLDEAAKYMADSANEVKDAIQKLNENMRQMDSQARSLSMSIQQEYQRRQQ